MSTVVYSQELYKDICTRKNIEMQLENAIIQLNKNLDEINIYIAGIEIVLDYKNDEIYIVA